MKTCSQCGEHKERTNFYDRKDARDGLRANCKTCVNARVGKWQRINRDKVRGYVRKACRAAYYADPEKHKAKSARRRAARPEHVREIVRRSNRKNYRKRYDEERARLNEAYARKRTSTPSWLTAIQRAQIREYYEVARALTCQTGIVHHVDHIHPLKGKTFSGLHVPWNLQILTASANSAKRNHMELA